MPGKLSRAAGVKGRAGCKDDLLDDSPHSVDVSKAIGKWREGV